MSTSPLHTTKRSSMPLGRGEADPARGAERLVLDRVPKREVAEAVVRERAPSNASGRYPSESTTSSTPWRSSHVSCRSRNGWLAIGSSGFGVV